MSNKLNINRAGKQFLNKGVIFTIVVIGALPGSVAAANLLRSIPFVQSAFDATDLGNSILSVAIALATFAITATTIFLTCMAVNRAVKNIYARRARISVEVGLESIPSNHQKSDAEINSQLAGVNP